LFPGLFRSGMARKLVTSKKQQPKKQETRNKK